MSVAAGLHSDYYTNKCGDNATRVVGFPSAALFAESPFDGTLSLVSMHETADGAVREAKTRSKQDSRKFVVMGAINTVQQEVRVVVKVA